MANIVQSDYCDNQQAINLKALLNAGCTLRLFINLMTATPGTALGAYTECALAGYAGQSLVADFGAISNPVSGTWQFSSTTHTFTTTDVVGQLVYGCYVDDGAQVYEAVNFVGGVLFSLAAPLVVQLTPRVKSEFLS